MNEPYSDFQTNSPSFPSVQQVSGDIFFKVKKQILDKLDIILQKVNLQVIEYLKLNSEKKEDKKSFRFIELSSFEKQIQTLFDYLDRLYESLNSSVSFSTNDFKNSQSMTGSNKNKYQQSYQQNSVLVNEINDMRVKFQQLGQQTFRLREQNEHMKFLIKNNFSNSVSLAHSLNQSSKGSLKNIKKQPKKHKDSYNLPQQIQRQQENQCHQSNSMTEGISLETVKKILRFYNHSIKQLSIQYKENMREIKKILKQVKFNFLESRVEFIAELKKWSQNKIVPAQAKQTAFGKQQNTKIKNSSVPSHIGQQFFHHQLEVEKCSEECIKRFYNCQDQKNAFQEDILQKIQQILDVC